jgi:hypothetical protein
MMNGVGINTSGNQHFESLLRKNTSNPQTQNTAFSIGRTKAEVDEYVQNLRVFNPVNSMQQLLKLNIWSIPPWKLPADIDLSVGDLSHEEWMETLDPKTRHRLDSHGNAEHLSHLNGMDRALLVSQIEHDILYYDKYYDELVAKAAVHGTVLSASVQTVPQQFAIFYIQKDNGENIVLMMFADGDEMLFDTPNGFDADKFQMYVEQRLHLFFDMHGLANRIAPVAELKDLFGVFIREMFGEDY